MEARYTQYMKPLAANSIAVIKRATLENNVITAKRRLVFHAVVWISKKMYLIIINLKWKGYT